MAFDGFVIHGIKAELSSLILDGKIEKIYQPEKDEIIISVRTKSGVFRVLLSASTSNARIHLTEETRENPITAPLFCMILRKHLSGGRIKAILQVGFDRILRFDIECYTEMGDLTEKSLILEIMGKHSNIILIQSDNKIIDSIKHVDFTTSAVRQVLPGLMYELPPAQNKLDPQIDFCKLFEAHIQNFPKDSLLDQILLNEFVGMSPLMAREIVYRKFKNTKIFLSDTNSLDFVGHTTVFIGDFLKNPFGGYVVFDLENGKPISFSCVKLTQYDGMGRFKEYQTLSQAVEAFFSGRSRHDRLSQKSASTTKLICNNIDRCNKKIAIHTENIKKAENRDKYKIFGELLTANLHRIEPHSGSITVQNYYSPDLEEITIPLKAELSPSKNAQRYYKLYTKAKTTEEHSRDQLQEAKTEKEYLETVLDSISRVSDYLDILEIRDELSEQGYISASSSKKKKKTKKTTPLEFVSSDGYTILVGRNNRQNDELTMKTAYSTDMWLHTKNIPGSHTIIRTGGSGEVPDQTLVEAASIAAYYSKAQKSSGVAVDYTLVKNIRKPNGSNPGFVIYETNYTVFVDPDEKLVKKLKK